MGVEICKSSPPTWSVRLRGDLYLLAKTIEETRAYAQSYTIVGGGTLLVAHGSEDGTLRDANGPIPLHIAALYDGIVSCYGQKVAKKTGLQTVTPTRGIAWTMFHHDPLVDDPDTFWLRIWDDEP